MSKKLIKSMSVSAAHLCVSNRSKHKDYPLYVHPYKVASYSGTEGNTENQNYRVVVKVNKKTETISYHKSMEVAKEVSKAVKVMQKLYKAELKAKIAEMKASL